MRGGMGFELGSRVLPFLLIGILGGEFYMGGGIF